MNRLTKAAVIALPFAASTGGLTYWFNEIDRSHDPAILRPDKVAACAQRLGNKAIKADSIPADCKPFSNAFSYEGSSTYSYHPDSNSLIDETSGSYKQLEDVTYQLPSSIYFKTQAHEAANSVKSNVSIKEEVLMGGLASLVLFGTIGAYAEISTGRKLFFKDQRLRSQHASDGL